MEPQISKEEEEATRKQDELLLSQQSAAQTALTNKAQWKLISEQAYKNYQDLQANKGWKEFDSGPCRKCELTIGSRVVSRGELLIEGYTIDQLFDFLKQPANLKVIDQMCEDTKQLEADGDYEVSWMKFKGIWPVAPRDFIFLTNTRKEGDVYYSLTKSINYEYPIEKGVVRAHCELGAYVFQKKGEKSVKLTYISDADPKGSIPGMIKNKISKMQAEVPTNFFKALSGKK